MSRGQIVPTAPTHTRVGPSAPQVKAATTIAENYYRAASWRSGYEWRQADAQEYADEQAGLRAPRGQTPEIVYSWQGLKTAQDYLRAASEQNQSRSERIAGNREVPSTRTQTENDDTRQLNGSSGTSDQHQQSAVRRPQDLAPTTATTDFSARTTNDASYSTQNGAPTDTQAHHSDNSTSGRQQQQQQQQQSTRTLTLAGIPVALRAPHPDQSLVAQRLARAGVTGSTHAQLHTLFHHPVHSPPATEQLGGRKTREFNSGVTHQKPHTFQLRGAGALPTHNETTRASGVRLAAGIAHHPNASAQVVDWSQWARDVEAKLANSQGTLQTSAPRTHATIRRAV